MTINKFAAIFLPGVFVVAMVSAHPVKGWTKQGDGTWSVQIPFSWFSGVNPFTDSILNQDGSVGGPAGRLSQEGAELILLENYSDEVVSCPGECLVNIAGITSNGKTVQGADAVERQGLGDGYQTKWGLEIGHLREGASCVYRGFDFSEPPSRQISFHHSSGMQDSCIELFDAENPQRLIATVFLPYTGGWKKYVTTQATLPEAAANLKALKIRFRHARKEDRLLPVGTAVLHAGNDAGTIVANFGQDPNVATPMLNAALPQTVESEIRAMVLVKRRSLHPSHVYTYHVEGLSKGGGLYVCDFEKGVVRRLVDASEGIIIDAQVSYDGQRILFSGKRSMSEPFAIWCINSDGSGLEKVIHGTCNNQNACWLPDGGIAFTSDRKPAFAYCWTSTSPVLYRADGDGKNAVRLSANYLTDFTPTVMGDGRILFSRWEYVDRPAIPIQSLWAIQPDGTGLSGIFGNRVLSPATFMFAHDVPGRSGVYLCIMTSHNGPCNGAVGLVDVSLGGNAQQAIRNLTPEVKVPPVENGIRGNGIRGPYTTPFPVDGGRYLVSRAGEIQLREYDSDNVHTLVKAPKDGLGWYSPQPLEPRAKPLAQRAEQCDKSIGPFAEIVVQDVRIGLEGYVQPGEIKKIAVVQEMEKDIRAETDKRQFGFQFPVVSCGATYAPKRVWGFAEVEADGSAHFLAPANVPIYFLPLDAEGRAVQRMRTFTHFMPGERQSCIGCHANRNYVSVSPVQIGKSMAAQRPPAKLVPPPWGSDDGFSFARVVQPVLSRHCVKCHSGEDGAPEPELTGDRTDYFNVAYENLARKGTGAESGGDVKPYMKNFGRNPYTSWIPTFNGLEENILWITPKTWGSPVSKLSQVIASGHPAENGKPRVSLTADERLRIHLWIDLDVPYYGTSQSRQDDLRGCRRILPSSITAVKNEIEKRKDVKLPYQFYVRYDHPERNSWLKEGISAGIFSGKDDPDYKRLLDEIVKARPMLDLRNDVDFRDVIW
ncbi:MAG: carbohydrate-binding protein [Kiritimatiellae bacterium]|nr:carbohydrate-binding protein [Kiritimatiellia bacterium]